MNDNHAFDTQDAAAIREMLSGSGYSEKAIDYYLNRPNMGSLPDADQVSELTGPCGDTMKVFLKVNEGRIKDARVQVLGCPGAVASAMVVMELIKGKTLVQAQSIKDRDIYRVLQEMPDKKLHCIRLSVKAMQKALEEYGSGNGDSPQGK